MVYSPWDNPGFGVCGHKNQYQSKVKLGNYVEELPHFRVAQNIKEECPKTEMARAYKTIDSGHRGTGSNVTDEEFEKLGLEFAPERRGLPYALLVQEKLKVSEGDIEKMYTTDHQRAFGKTQAPEVLRTKSFSRDMHPYVTVTKLAMREGIQIEQDQAAYYQCSKRFATKHDFTKTFLQGAYLKR